VDEQHILQQVSCQEGAANSARFAAAGAIAFHLFGSSER